MHKDQQQKLDQWFRGQGKELEAAMGEAGTPLPEGVTGEMFVREMLTEAERLARSPEGQARAARIRELMEQVVAELPGGVQDPAFEERMKERMNEIFGQGSDGSNASA
jgi:hypothetical protein